MKNPLRYFLFALPTLFLLCPRLSTADDVGLITARLTEHGGFNYVLEADVTPQLRETLFEPSLPPGFTRLKTEYAQQGALINIRYPFVGNRALETTDTLSLPWNRSGVLLQSKWLDGSRGSDLFLRTTQGIPVELSRIKKEYISLTQHLQSNLFAGFNTGFRNGKLWLPILAIALLFPTATAIRYCWMLAGGFAGGLLIPDFYAVTIAPSISILLVLVAVLMAARMPDKPLSPVFILAALVLGLACTAGQSYELRTASLIGLLAFYIISGALLIYCRSLIWKEAAPHWISIGIGGVTVAALILTIVTPEPAKSSTLKTPVLSSIQPATGKTAVKQAPRKLTDPFVVFLSIEPYEVRLEIMASGRAITELLDFKLTQENRISIKEQSALKQQAIEKLEQLFSLSCDETVATPSLKRGDFLTLGTAGAFTRTEEVPEVLDDAIVGLTFAYIRSGPPQKINVSWSQLPNAESAIPATVIEPGGNQGFTFTTDQLSLVWLNESDALDPVEISAVDVRRPSWAPVSFLLLIGAFIYGIRKPKVSYTCIALTLLAFPLIRIPLPYGSPLPPAQAESIVEQLLTNVYRSFDFRQENAIYDQLALSVSGDQLTEIYLDQRRALELENRGGARARVETVKVLDIESVQTTKRGADITARWNVSGSVNHFGHTHYRQNAYHATLQLIPVDGVWKIIGIDVYEEKRIY